MNDLLMTIAKPRIKGQGNSQSKPLKEIIKLAITVAIEVTSSNQHSKIMYSITESAEVHLLIFLY